jgi:thiol-disulfide isomerase/thioredoxin
MWAALAVALSLGLRSPVRRPEEASVLRVSAGWCAPCLEMQAGFRAAARAFQGLARFSTIDADVDAAAARRLGVRSLPATVVRFRGRTVERDIGYLTPGEQWALGLRAALWPALAQALENAGND